jgi:hypothetical protein
LCLYGSPRAAKLAYVIQNTNHSLSFGVDLGKKADCQT